LLSRSASHRTLSTPSQGPRRNRSIWPSFTTISPKYRWIPLLGCSIIFINEAEYYIKQVATMRAIEAMYCYEFYIAQNSPLAELGKHIPERLCKEKSIQKDLAGTAGLIMFVRMLSSILGAIPLGWVADKYGRKVVLILHKVNVTITCTSWLVLCKFSNYQLAQSELKSIRSWFSQSTHLDTLPQRAPRVDWWQL
jgi:hypothetical protein